MAENQKSATDIKFQQICGMVYGKQGKVHLWSYINQALSWINMDENWNCPTTFVISNTEHVTLNRWTDTTST
jgi:hypothetical protein